MDMKSFKKAWFNSLSFLDNCTIHAVIVIILLLYSSTIFNNINSYVGNLYRSNIVKVIVLLLIVYVSPKDTMISVLLAISYMVSLSYMSNRENFASSGPVQTAMQQAPTMRANMQQKVSSHMTAEEQNMLASKKQNLKNKVTTEHFFPLPGVNESEFKQKNNSKLEKINQLEEVNKSQKSISKVEESSKKIAEINLLEEKISNKSQKSISKVEESSKKIPEINLSGEKITENKIISQKSILKFEESSKNIIYVIP
jgi:hypothetical protein